ncbi:MAG: TlpA family protein disulfide reductase [Candidatus Moraniibacteriota bacterium]|nr:MAG: TlpA family protein disulfide reductase [Candidatus Moranbacteria bacterium]
MTIGSKAPALDVEHWVQNGNGKFKPVTKFENGKVYVVEFWATWCGPCIASMPHLAETQKQYAEKGVQLVSISDEDLETVEGFLKRELAEAGEGEGEKKEDAPKTYRDLTSAYCLTTDPDGSSQKDYMEAAKQNGIPTAFIVGKSGEIEWIGHPMEMDEPLKSVVEDKWDRAAYIADFKAKQEAQAQMQKLFALLNRGKMDEATKMLDELIEKTKDAQSKTQFQMIKLQVMLQDESKKEEVAAFAKTVLDSAAEDPMMINQLCWAFVQMTEQGQIDNPELLKTALTATAAASEKAEAESKGAILDTLAHLYQLTGDLDKAIETQKKAVASAGEEMKAELEEFLKKLEEEKAGK